MTDDILAGSKSIRLSIEVEEKHKAKKRVSLPPAF